MSNKGKPHTIAKIFHNYKAQSENELSLTKGETVKVFEKFPNGWWVGETSDGKLGVFPGSYVKEITTQNESKDKPVNPISTTTKQVKKENKTEEKEIGNSSSSTTTENIKKRKTRIPISQATVLYNYQGKTETELSLTKGTIINVLKKLQPEGWWQGEYEGKFGHFPGKYVKEIEKKQTEKSKEEPQTNKTEEKVKESEKVKKEQKEEIKIEETNKKEDDTSNKSSIVSLKNENCNYFAIALYDYSGDNSDELSFKKGSEIFTSDKFIDNEWAQGLSDNSFGNFPIKYVTRVNISDLLEETSKEKRAIAMYNFQALDPSEISLQKGKLLTVIEDGPPEAWWKGKYGDNIGHFPGNYVKLLPFKSCVIEKLLNVGDIIKNKPNTTENEIIKQEEHKEHKKKLSQSNNDAKNNNNLNKPDDMDSVVSSLKDLNIKEENENKSSSNIEESKTTSEESNSNNDNNNNDNKQHKRQLSSSTSQKANKKSKKSKKNVKSLTTIGICSALYDYTSVEPNIISFSKGDNINIYRKQKSGWWKGEINGKVGFFPSSYVSYKSNNNNNDNNNNNNNNNNLTDNSKIKRLSKKPTIVQAILDFNGESETELSFKKGDLFYQTDSNIFGDGWLRGEKNGQRGYFPQSYVKPIVTNDEISELKDIVMDIQKQINPTKHKRSLSSSSSFNNRGDSNDLLRKLEESEKQRISQQKEINILTSKVDGLSVKVSKQADIIAKQQKSLRKLSKQNGTSSSSNADVVKLREYLDIEVRQRRDLESIIRKLETHHETLSRQVTRLQRSSDKKATKEQLGVKKLRHTGIDLTQ